MEKLRERLSYLQGMADGLGLSNHSKEGRVVVEIMGLMENIAAKLEAIDNRLEEQDDYLETIDNDLIDLEEFVSSMDEDLNEVEQFLFDDDTDYEEDEMSEDDGEIITVDGIYDEMEGYDDDEGGYFEVECPKCKEMVSVDQDIFDDDMIAEVLCPDCHEVILVNDEEEKKQFVID